MEDGDNGESADDVTEPVFAPAGRRQSHGLQNKQGYSKCHICDARDGLRTVSQARLADAYHSMKKEMHIQLQLSKKKPASGSDPVGLSGLPTTHSKLCPACFPELTAHRIIGADIAVSGADDRIW